MEVCGYLGLSSSHHLMGPADNLAAELEVLLNTHGFFVFKGGPGLHLLSLQLCLKTPQAFLVEKKLHRSA